MDKPRRIAVVYNSPEVDADQERFLGDMDTVLTAKEVFEALNRRGYEAELISVSSASDLDGLDTDLVFNLCEWTGNETYKTCQVLERLDEQKIAYTGANAKNYLETSEKVLMKKLLDQYNLPTPKWAVLEKKDSSLPDAMRFPLIVKLALEHGSVGMTQESVVEDENQLRVQVGRVLEKYRQPVLVEEFIIGKEINATLIGNGEKATVLPITEMEFGVKDAKWNILTFSSKFLDRTEEYKGSYPVCPTRGVDAAVLERAKVIAKKAYLKFECRDYARMDMRVDLRGKVWILEVNSNPSLENAWISSMVSARAFGWTYEDIIEKIVTTAWSRVMAGKVFKNEGPRQVFY